MSDDEIPEAIQVRLLAAVFFAARLFRAVGLVGLTRQEAAKHSALDAKALIQSCKDVGS